MYTYTVRHTYCTQDLAGDGVERIPVPANLWVWRSSSFCPTMYLKNISKQLFPHMCNTYVSYPCTMCTYMIFLSVCTYISLTAYLHVYIHTDTFMCMFVINIFTFHCEYVNLQMYNVCIKSFQLVDICLHPVWWILLLSRYHCTNKKTTNSW